MEQEGKKTRRARGIEITPEIRRRFRSYRSSAQLNVADLARIANVSEKLIKNIESNTSGRSRFDESKLTDMCAALGCTLDELLYGASDGPTGLHVPGDFESLTALTEKLDANLMPLIRDLRQEIDAVEEAYQDLLLVRLQKQGIPLEILLRNLHGPHLSDLLIRTAPRPDLEIDVSDGFDRLTFRYEGHSLNVEKPQLLWDCNCATPGAKHDASQCPIHSQEEGAAVGARFASGRILLKYRDRVFHWRNTKSLWPPSVDSFAMFDDLRRMGLMSSDIDSVLDLGAGTGFLGIMLALENPRVTRLDLSDWMLTPTVYARTNWLINSEHHKYVRARCRLGLLAQWFGSMDEPYDVVLCNPPYLPLLPGFDELGLDATVDQLINDESARFTQAEQERSNGIGQAENQRKAAQKKAIEEFTSEANKNLESGKKGFEQALADQESAGNTVLSKLDKHLKDAKRIIGLISNTGMAGHYQKVANREWWESLAWRVIAMVFFIATGGLVFWVVYEVKADEFKWEVGLFRLAAAGILLAPAFYATRVAARHKALESHNRRLELEFASITPYLDTLSNDKSQAVIEKLAERYFGNQHASETDEVDGNLKQVFLRGDQIVLLVERVLKVLRK